MGTLVQIQNQKGQDPLRWDKSGVVVENLGNHQYTVRMDGSGRVTLRNRKFLRKIRPLIERNLIIDDILDHIPVHNKKEVTIEEHVPQEAVVQGEGDELPVVLGGDEELRRSMRTTKPPERYEAKW